MNQKFFTPIETAKQLRKAGYPDRRYCYWMVTDDAEPKVVTIYDKEDYEEEGVDATFIPTSVYHEVQAWLNIKKHISLGVEYNQQAGWNYKFEMTDVCDGGVYAGGSYVTREEALNAGILSILDILKSKRSKKGL